MHDFQNVVYDCWFTPYRRVTNNDSSGFEHVMVGEEKDGKITGLHNWIQYYVEEKKGNIDYLGWVGKQDQNNGDDVNLVSVAFAWADDDPETEVKPMSTSERMALPARLPACLPACSCVLPCHHCRLAGTSCLTRLHCLQTPPRVQCSWAAASSGRWLR
jgi:hypothetical protein